MSNDGYPDRLLKAPSETWAFASFVLSAWTLRSLVALGVFNAAQAQQVIEWAAEDAETISDDLGMRTAALIRALTELPGINESLRTTRTEGGGDGH